MEISPLSKRSPADIEPMDAYSLQDYIDKFFDGSIPAFADAQETTRHHIHKWIDRGAVVVNGAVYTFRRHIESE